MLGAGDEVALAIFGDTDISRNYKIGPDGTIDLPLVGRVRAAGMAISQLAMAVQQKLADGFMRNPTVAGSIVSYRPFYILGEVNKPGEYSYRSGLTLDGAVALAGGYTYRAQPRWVLIQSENSDTESRVALTPDLVVRPGDTIRIAERFF